MRLLVGKELVELSDEYLSTMFIGTGREANVYRYGNEALKLHNLSDVSKLSLEDALRLSEINTTRVLLPKRMIYNPDDGEFLGYTTEFISKRPIMDLFRMNVFNFANEIDVMEADVLKLSDCRVEIDDFILKNTVYGNGHMYLVDPGSFAFFENRRVNVHGSNEYEFRDYVVYELLSRVAYSRRRKDYIDSIFYGYDASITDIIRETARENETVKQYVKRITK